MQQKKLLARLGSTEAQVERELVVERLDDGGQTWRIVVDGDEKVVDARRLESGSWSLLIDGRSWVVDVLPGQDGTLMVSAGGLPPKPVKLVDPRRERLAQTALRGKVSGPEVVKTQMPGKVVKVLVQPGDPVTAGQPLVVVEAMKMENELRATRDGAVKEVHVSEGQAVEAGETLVTVE